MTDSEALELIHALIDEGWLVGVQVFGSDDCCEHGDYTECPADGFGLCDVFSKNSCGSDCNGMEPFLLRPHRSFRSEALRLKIIEE